MMVNSFGEQKIKIKINGQHVKDIYLKSSMNKFIVVDIPKNECKNGRNRVLLEIPNAKSPKELGMDEDTRALGVGLIQILLD